MGGTEPEEEVEGTSADKSRAQDPPADPEALALLGEVRSPVGIPKQYRPSDTSAHQLLRVEFGEFAGPLDLLLYLIRQHDLDILNIPIAFITEKYLGVLDTLSELPIDVAGEFLVMAAELAHIKSKMLLPPKEGVPLDPEDEDEGDPRNDLVRRLLEYQKYRDAAGDLADRDQLGRDVFSRQGTSDLAVEDFDPGLRDLSIFRLVESMADVLARLEPESQHEVIADTVTIAERARFILDLVAQHGDRLAFLALFEGIESRRVVVMTFVAILELARTGVLRIEQQPDTPLEEPEARPPEPPPAPVAAEQPLEEELPRIRFAAELPPLRAPLPGEIVLVFTGKMPEVAAFGEAVQEYR